MSILESEAIEAYQYYLTGEYEKAASAYEATLADTINLNHCWYLGLAYLLSEDEDAAQLTWLSVIETNNEQETDNRRKALAEVLETEAQRFAQIGNLKASWLIRQYLQEIDPSTSNILYLIELGIDTDANVINICTDHQLIVLLQDQNPGTIDPDLLHRVFLKLLSIPIIELPIVEVLRAAIPHIHQPQVISTELLNSAVKLRFEHLQCSLAVELAELARSLDPNSLIVLRHLSRFYADVYRYDKSIEVAKQFGRLCKSPETKLLGESLLLQSFLTASHYGPELWATKSQLEIWLATLVNTNPTDLDRGNALPLTTAISCYSYLQDQPQVHRPLQNQVARIAQKNLRACADQLDDLAKTASIRNPKTLTSSKPLKIGYIAHTLKQHSVGWISRWLFQHHDHDVCHISLYLLAQGVDEFTSHWFVNQADACWKIHGRDEITARILADEIDILVDLDSYTLNSTTEIMALKPAPIQVTWLGADASGLPAIDYFIADPYVLPENAQDYYQEKIWRLPHTYLAVDGFEVGVPTLRRDNLNIPADAVIYFSGQTGPKRHPDTVHLQLKILKEVPNSYFLVKSIIGDKAAIEQQFIQLAEEVGISPERLRFLDGVPDPSVHRANLAIADVILDTYPYNGATTTLEALWEGVPLVTRVGQQFAARNSYAFLTNLGITEGIAWTDEEYVEWGVRLGKDESFRQQVAQKLKASRQTSPLWNAKQFTREMEKMYQQMWQIYLKSGTDR